MLSAAQRASFDERGLLRLPGWAPARAVAALRTRILELFRERRLVPDPVPAGHAVTPSHTSRLASAHRFDEVWGAETRELLDELLGAGAWQPPECAGQILAVTFPLRGGTWRLPHRVWHLDYQAPAALRGLPGLQLFLCLDRVAPRAGGTLVVCGSHRLIEAIRRGEAPEWPGRSAEVRKRLRAGVPWLRELWSLREGEDRESRFMRETSTEGGVPLQVAELSGEPGDVYAMHPWLLHAPSVNCGTLPRMVLTQRVHV